MKTSIKVALTLLLFTGSLYSKSTSIQPSALKEMKANTFLEKAQNSPKRFLLAFLIKPVSFSPDLSLDFKKVFSAPVK